VVSRLQTLPKPSPQTDGGRADILKEAPTLSAMEDIKNTQGPKDTRFTQGSRSATQVAGPQVVNISIVALGLT
jgi:hypothetical protein